MLDFKRSWGFPAIGPMRDLTFPNTQLEIDEEMPQSLAEHIEMLEKQLDNISPTKPPSVNSSSKQSHPLLLIEFPIGDTGDWFQDRIEWIPSSNGEYLTPHAFARSLGLDFGLSLEVVEAIADSIQRQLNPPRSKQTSSGQIGPKNYSRYSDEGGAGSARKRGRTMVSPSIVGPASMIDPGRQMERDSITDEMRQKVQAMLKEQQEPYKVKATRLPNTNCHICHNRKDVCFRCCPQNLHNHSYCASHVKLRFDLTEADLKEDPWLFSYCPVCTLTCSCSACLRKLDNQAAAMFSPDAPISDPGGFLPLHTPVRKKKTADSTTSENFVTSQKKKQAPNCEEQEDEVDEGYDNVHELLEDGNTDYCSICRLGGGLVCCDTCPRAFHLDCLNMNEADLPPGNWSCQECLKEGREDFIFTICPGIKKGEKDVFKMCITLVDFFYQHEFALAFREPIDVRTFGLENYLSMVKKPMDLGTVRRKLQSTQYSSPVEVLTDIRLVWHNCKTYNMEGSAIWRMADHLSRMLERAYEKGLQPHLCETDQLLLAKHQAEFQDQSFATHFLPNVERQVTRSQRQTGEQTPQSKKATISENLNSEEQSVPQIMLVQSRNAHYVKAAKAVFAKEDSLHEAMKKFNVKNELKLYRIVENLKAGMVIKINEEEVIENEPAKDSSRPETVVNKQTIDVKNTAVKEEQAEKTSKTDMDAGKRLTVTSNVVTRTRLKEGQARASGKRPKGTETGAAGVTTTKGQKDLKYQLGQEFQKEFPGYGTFWGKIIAYRKPYYKVRYEDGDEEEMTKKELDRQMNAAMLL